MWDVLMYRRIALIDVSAPLYATVLPTNSYLRGAPPTFSSVAWNVSMCARIIHISNKFAVAVPLYYPYPLDSPPLQSCAGSDRTTATVSALGNAVREPRETRPGTV